MDRTRVINVDLEKRQPTGNRKITIISLIQDDKSLDKQDKRDSARVKPAVL